MKNCNAIWAGDGTMISFIADAPFLWEKLTTLWIIIQKDSQKIAIKNLNDFYINWEKRD